MQNAQPKRRKSKRVDALKLCTIDIETTPFEPGIIPAPFLVCFFDGEKFWDFWGPDCCRRFAAWFFDNPEAPRRALIYAHNGGKFDFHYLFPALSDQNAADPFRKQPEIVWLRGGLMKFRFSDRLAEFRDSMLILPVPLRDMETGKTSIPVDWHREDQQEAHREEITSYCRADCRALYAAVTRYRGEFGQHFTIGGSALKMAQDMGAFEVRKNKREHFDATLRKYYFAGRCQAFVTGEHRGLIKVFDMVSAYPWAMTLPLWHNFEQLETRQLPANRKRMEACLLTVKGHSRGAFPVRLEDETGELTGRVFYPDAIGPFNVTGAEFLAAVETGCFKGEVVHCRVPQELCTFEKFVRHCFANKDRCEKGGDATGRLFWKLLMNNLSGKLATDPREMKVYQTLAQMESDPETLEDLLAGRMTWQPAGTIGAQGDLIELVSKPMEKDRWQFLNVATAATITGHVRARLIRSIISCPETPLYCDTDSLFYRVPEDMTTRKSLAWQNWTPFPVGDGLGEWKEDCRGDLIGIAREKLYALRRPGKDWKTASAGAELSFSDILRAVRGIRVENQKIAPTFTRESLERAIFVKRSFEKKSFSQKKYLKTLDCLKKMGFSEILSLSSCPQKI